MPGNLGLKTVEVDLLRPGHEKVSFKINQVLSGNVAV